MTRLHLPPTLPILLALTALPILLPSPAHAQATTPEFFFESPGQTPGSYTQGLSSLSVGAGATFTVSVWLQYQPTVAATYYGMDVFIGFDQANSVGASATPQNHALALPSSLNATTAVTNVNPILIDLSNVDGGGQDPADATTPSSAVRPYGDDVQLAASNVAGFGATGAQPIHLFDLTLQNVGLGAGGSQPLVIYSNDPAGSGTSFTTYLDNGSGNPSSYARPGASTLLRIFQPADSGATPEPGALPLVFFSLPLIVAGRRRSGRISLHGDLSPSRPARGNIIDEQNEHSYSLHA